MSEGRGSTTPFALIVGAADGAAVGTAPSAPNDVRATARPRSPSARGFRKSKAGKERESSMKPQEVMSLIKEQSVKAVDLRFVDLPGHVAALHSIDQGVRGRRLRGGHRLRRLLDPRVPGDPGVGHAPVPGPRQRVPRPVHRGADAGADLRRQGPGDRRGLHPRPALHRHQGRALPQVDRDRRHRVLRPRARVLHLRRRPLRPVAPTSATTTSTPPRASGTAARTRSRTWATSRATRKATSRCRRPTATRTSAPR